MDPVGILLPGLAAAASTLLLTPMMIRLSFALRALDAPGGRKRHAQSTPRLGGIAIIVGIAAGIAVAMVPGLGWLAESSLRALPRTEIVGLVASTVLVFGVGLLDDLFGLRALHKLLVQFAAAAVIVGMGWQFAAVRLPFEGSLMLGVLAPLLSLLWIVGVTNAINFIDGLDGLAAGIVAIIAGSLAILAILQGGAEVGVLSACIGAACLGFLRHNWRPAKIYMGDSGSLTLGFLLATISLHSDPSLKASVTVAILVPLLALGLPVIDTLLVMWFRFLRGKRLLNRIARMLSADRAHLHHLLIDGRTERRRVMMILYGSAAGFCLMALLVAASGSVWLGVGFLAIEFAAVYFIRRIGLNSAARAMADDQLTRLDQAEPKPAVEAGGREIEEASLEDSDMRLSLAGVGQSPEEA